MRCQRVIGRRSDGTDNPCSNRGRFRVSDPNDPWPLSYACERCLTAVVSALGGDVKVTTLAPGEPAPQPRPPEVAPFHGHSRVFGQPSAIFDRPKSGAPS